MLAENHRKRKRNGAKHPPAGRRQADAQAAFCLLSAYLLDIDLAQCQLYA
jgi:hypothetical protein